MQYPQELVHTIAQGGLAVIPTDTIYGIVGRALSESVVEELYRIKKRNPDKPLIVLISDLDQLSLFNIFPEAYAETASAYWPGPVSVILPCHGEEFRYLHRGTHTIAFRLPADEGLRALIRETGPIVAPSANQESLPPASTIAEAQKYFGDTVGCYVDGGEIHGSPSAVIRINEDGTAAKLR